MARRRPVPEITNSHDRWLVSYADFLTLLFAFFVVMYSTSALENGSYRALSDSIVRAFGQSSAGEEGQERPSLRVGALPEPHQDSLGTTEAIVNERRLNDLRQSLAEMLQGDMAEDAVSVASTGDYIDVVLPAEMLFPSGAGTLLASAIPLLTELADVLASIPNDLLILAHTDSSPIRNGLFPSNWELAAARAATIARILEAEGIDPQRLAALGYADSRPVADNTTPQGRARNRRVVLRITGLNGSGSAAGNGGSV